MVTMTSGGANDVTGRRHEGRSANPWSKLVIAGTVGGACTVVTACFVLCILVCRRWIRDRRAARRRRLKRRQRTVSTNSSMMRGSSATPSVSSARHTLPALPGEDLSIPLPPDVDVNGGAMTWWNQPKHAVVDWSVDSNRARGGRDACQTSPLVAVDVPRSLRRSSASSVSAPTTHGEDAAVHDVWWSSVAAAACVNDRDTTTQRYMPASRSLTSQQANVINTGYPTIHRHGGESDRWKADTSPLNSRDNDTSTDVNFNLSQYIIQRENDGRQRHRAGQWHTSRSADASATNRNWRRADVADDAPARERNTWELTHRFPEFPVRALPAARLVTGSAWSGVDERHAPGDSSDEDVWIPRLPNQSSRRRANDAAACAGRDGCELKSSRGDVLRTRTKPATRVCSTRS